VISPAGPSRALAAIQALGLAFSACAPRESTEQRVTRLRLQYEVRPSSVQPDAGPDGRPGVVIGLLLANQGREGLARLTLVARLVGQDGRERVVRPFTVDTSGVAPGVTTPISSRIPDVELREGEMLTVELESDPPASARASYPEYRSGLSSSG